MRRNWFCSLKHHRFLIHLIFIPALFTLTACGSGSSGGANGGSSSINNADPTTQDPGIQNPDTQNPDTQNPDTQNPDGQTPENQNEDSNPVDSQGGNPNRSLSYFPTSSTDPALSTLQWQYVFSQGDITSTIESATVTANLSTISVQMANTVPTERLVQYSGPVRVTEGAQEVTGRIENILSQDITSSNGRTFTSNLETNVLVTIFADDDFGQLETEVDLQINYPEPAEIFLDRDDLDQRVGEVFSQQISGTVSGSVSIKDGISPSEVQNLPSASATVTETYTVTQVLSSVTVQGVTYNDVVTVDYSYNQLNAQTGELEPTTTTYYLARGIGLIKATNLSQLYGTQLDWDLVSTNLPQ